MYFLYSENTKTLLIIIPIMVISFFFLNKNKYFYFICSLPKNRLLNKGSVNIKRNMPRATKNSGTGFVTMSFYEFLSSFPNN